MRKYREIYVNIQKYTKKTTIYENTQLLFELILDPEKVQGTKYSLHVLDPIRHPPFVFPEKRFYPVQSTSTTEAAIDTSLLRDIYIVLGDKKSDESWVVRTYIKPFIIWIF